MQFLFPYAHSQLERGFLAFQDLREKNWKAMDAVATAEANGKKKIKETEEAILVRKITYLIGQSHLLIL